VTHFQTPRKSGACRILIKLASAPNAWFFSRVYSRAVGGAKLAKNRRVRRHGDPAKRWLSLLANHREVIVAFDFFTVPKLTFKLLYASS
jgi:hypothetical protein